MRTAGIREARQNLSKLIEAVKQGQEVVITDRGTPVARLVGPVRRSARKFTDRSDFRAEMPELDPPLSQTVSEGRRDRI